MTGAGTTDIAWTQEDAFGSIPGDPTYVYPGRNVQVTEIDLDNALQRSRLPDQIQSEESIAQLVEGAFAIEYELTLPWHHEFALGAEPTEADGTHTWEVTPGQIPTQRYYVGINTFDGTAERELKGVVTTQLQYQLSVGETVRATQTCIYADEQKNTSITPGTIEGGDESAYVFHGGDLVVDSDTLKKIQQATLEIPNGAHLHRGWEGRKAVDAAIGAVDPTLTVTKIVDAETSSLLTLAYGNATAPTDNSDVDGADATLTFERGADEITFDLGNEVTPNTYGWENIPPTDEEDVQESIQFHVPAIDEVTADVAAAYPF